MYRMVLAAAAAVMMKMGCMGAGDISRGQDLLPVFSRAHAGLPLRVTTLGGSITQAGGGWIGPWLREQFPKAAVSVHNAGMSATGSQLGVFRLDRDVISAQPDLVMIEFAVNDGGLSDEDCVRYVESIVVRLKSLPHPPAIVFLEAAAREGSNRARHQRVAAHYKLLDIDLQGPLDKRLKSTGAEWSSLMSDSVHPNEAGHAFYAQVIEGQLAPYVEAAKEAPLQAEAAPLPARLSTLPLVLDGRLMPLDPAPGWRKQHSLQRWWDMFFTGVVSADEPGTELVVPARGTFIGLFYALDKSYGSFYLSLDGGPPELVDASVRGGYSYRLPGRDVAPGEHLLRVAVARPIGKPSGSVKLGYLLVAGGGEAGTDLAPQGEFRPAEAAKRTFSPIPAKAWEWCGSFGRAEKTEGPTADLDTVFAPEIKADSVAWKHLEGDDPLVDFAAITGRSDRGVCYARTVVQRQQAGKTLIALRLDYFGKLWVNGELVRVIDGNHGNPKEPMMIPVALRAGANDLLFKLHSGSRGNCFAAWVGDEETTP